MRILLIFFVPSGILDQLFPRISIPSTLRVNLTNSPLLTPNLSLYSMVNGFDFSKMFGRKDPELVSKEVKQYNERRFKQMALFYGFTVATFICSKIAYRGVIKRRYVPNYYQHNHVAPPFSFYRDALSAVFHSTSLAITSLGMACTGVLWYYDISSVAEFSFKLKQALGGHDKEQELKKLPEDETVQEIQNSINSYLGDR
ncbi:Altered inheritance of mitochondria protein 11 [Komagataella kurtzmanii]|nr:Altered inheritance of mitochondria protein 11 [Komagataella kurtzmanii]